MSQPDEKPQIRADDPRIQQEITRRMREKVDARQRPDGETLQQFVEWQDAALADVVYDVLKDAEPVGEFWKGEGR